MGTYYYLKGADKIGPLSKKQLFDENINGETLIWTEGQDQWLPLCEMPELEAEFNKLPPPVPDFLNEKSHDDKNKSKSLKPDKKEKNERTENVLNLKAKQRTTRLLIVSMTIIFVVGSFFISYRQFSRKKNDAKLELKKEIETVLHGNNAICDVIYSNVSGIHFYPKYTSKGVKIKHSETKNNGLILRRFTDSIIDANTDYITKKAWESRNISSYFIRTGGGFTVYELLEFDKGYLVNKSNSTDMEYLMDPIRNYRSQSGEPQYFLSINECYLNARKAFAEDNRTALYYPNTFEFIKKLNKLHNDYYQMELSYTSYKETNTDNRKIDYNSEVGNGYYKIYVTTSSKYYTISERKERIKQYRNKTFTIGISIGIILSVCFSLITDTMRKNK
jgi:hypothetical protein